VPPEFRSAEDLHEPELAQAVTEFNSGAYFACHETLEELWLGTPEPERRLYQGILQVAAGLLHLERGNRSGALTLLSRGSALLRPFAPTAHGLDIGALLADTARLQRELEEGGPEAMARLDRRNFPRLKTCGPTSH